MKRTVGIGLAFVMVAVLAASVANAEDYSFDSYRRDDGIPWGETHLEWNHTVDITADGRYMLGSINPAYGEYDLSIWDDQMGTRTLLDFTAEGCETYPKALSADASKIACTCGSGPTGEAAIVNNGELAILPEITGELSSNASDISGDGSKVIGTAVLDRDLWGGVYTNHSWIWTQATGKMDLGVVEGASTIHAKRISEDGSTVVGWFQSVAPGEGRVPVMWRSGAGSGERILPVGWGSSEASAVNSDGTCIVGWAIGHGVWLWEEGSAVRILGGDLEGEKMQQASVSDDCDTVFAHFQSAASSVWTESAGVQSFKDYLDDRGVLAADLSNFNFSAPHRMTGDARVFIGDGFQLDDMPPLFMQPPHSYVMAFDRPELLNCKIDWDGNRLITQDDYLVGDPIGGFYAEWYIYRYYPSYYPILFPLGDTARLDFDEDGDIDDDDLMGPLDAVLESEGFYVEWYIYTYYPEYYPIFMPGHCIQA